MVLVVIVRVMMLLSSVVVVMHGVGEHEAGDVMGREVGRWCVRAFARVYMYICVHVSVCAVCARV